MKKILALVIIMPTILGVMIYFNAAPKLFWFFTGMYLFFLIYAINFIYQNFQEKYYVLSYYGKEAYFEGKLSNNINNELPYVAHIGSFQACCDYLNSFKDNSIGLIVDEYVRPVGKLNDKNKWVPVR